MKLFGQVPIASLLNASKNPSKDVVPSKKVIKKESFTSAEDVVKVSEYYFFADFCGCVTFMAGTYPCTQ